MCDERGWTGIRFLGAGATAAVFQIETPEGDRALKLFSSKFSKGRRGDLTRRRLDLVIEKLRDHRFPSLIPIYEGGGWSDSLYMLMGLALGHCLGNVLQDVPREQIRSIISHVAAAAEFLESKELCHRDIKSDNIAVSADFSDATLLDLGVVRGVEETDTVGTDNEGQLPFVATARYSSPEYMFRLVPPGPDLWRGLTFYQLGGVLYELINREKLFENAVARAVDNRYLIAHAVATEVPAVRHDPEVPLDLVLLTERALEKDLTRRLASIRWVDFKEPSRLRQAESVLGLTAPPAGSISPSATGVASTWARNLELVLNQRLAESGIHCGHSTDVASAEHAVVELKWLPPSPTLPSGANLVVQFEFRDAFPSLIVDARAELLTRDGPVLASPSRPVVRVSTRTEADQTSTLLDHMHEAFVMLSAELVTSFLNASSMSTQ